MVAAAPSAAARVVAARSACALPRHPPASAVVGSSSVAPRPDHGQTDPRCWAWETTRSSGENPRDDDGVADAGASQSKEGEDENVSGGDEAAHIGSSLDAKSRH